MKMGWTCRTNGKIIKVHTQFRSENMHGRDCWGKHWMAGSVVSWEKWVWGCRLNLSGSELGTVTGFYENFNRGTVWVLDQLSVCCLVNKDCVSLMMMMMMMMIIIIIYLSWSWATCSGLTYPEVSSKVCHNSFFQLGSSVSLPWVICYETFYLHVVSSSSCIPVICPELVLFLIP
jgi:hypothetical protein